MSTVTNSTRVFFSFPGVIDPARHHDYNAWHQLDHQPENLALPGVVHGDRWVRSPDCRAASAIDTDDSLTAADYVAMYWFATPTRASIDEWLSLGATTREMGRRPELAWTERHLTGFFRPLEGRVAPSVELSVDALPFRAHRGVVLEVHRAEDPTSVAAEAGFGRVRRDLVTPTLALPGVTGSWTFGSRDVTLNAATHDNEQPERLTSAGALQVVLHWCEDDPVTVAAAMPDPLDEPGLTTILRTPLRTITPWEWNWFDGARRPS